MRLTSVGVWGALGATLLSCGERTTATETQAKGQSAKTVIDCPASKPLAKLVAQSDLIVIASPEVPTERLRSAMLEDHPGYVEVPLRDASMVKGASDGPELVVKVYPKRTTYAPAPEALLQRTGKPTMLFLTRVDEGPAGLYLTRSLEAVQEASTSQRPTVEAEVRRQKSIVALSAIDPSVPHFNRVRKLLAKLPRASEQGQKSIFQELEALGQDGVPAIVGQMDDRTPLAHQRISLVNYSPDAFEGLSHYGPELVVDALDAILSQITGFGGSIVNGGSERERENAVAAWRVYSADMRCE